MTRKLLELTTAVVALFCVFLIATPAAFAHAHPVSMTPAKDSIVSAPTEVSIIFSEELEPKLSSITLADATGKLVSKATSAVDPKNAKHMTLQLPTLAPAVYTVQWVSLALDGHKLTGSYTFTVK